MRGVAALSRVCTPVSTPCGATGLNGSEMGAYTSEVARLLVHLAHTCTHTTHRYGQPDITDSRNTTRPDLSVSGPLIGSNNCDRLQGRWDWREVHMSKFFTRSRSQSKRFTTLRSLACLSEFAVTSLSHRHPAVHRACDPAACSVHARGGIRRPAPRLAATIRPTRPPPHPPPPPVSVHAPYNLASQVQMHA